MINGKIVAETTTTNLAQVTATGNGQSVGYTNGVANCLYTTTDDELSAGFEALLNRYRRINIVSRKCNHGNLRCQQKYLNSLALGMTKARNLRQVV